MIKRRAIGIVLTVVAMAFAMIPLMGNDKAFADDNVVATIGDKAYTSLAAAVEAARTEKTTIVLEANTVEGVVIPAGADITIDLQGHTIKNAPDESQAEGKPHTFENFGKLELLSSEGEGVIDNITHAKACVMNQPGGEVIISGKLYLSRSNLPLPASAQGRGTWYNICNRGEMTINEGVRVINNDKIQTTVTTGFLELKDIPTPGYEAKLTVNGGYFEGNLNALKVDSAGELIFNNGEAVNESGVVIISWHKMTINGGTIRGATPLNLSKYNGSKGGCETELGITQINGGTFTCGQRRTMFTKHDDSIGGAELTIEGGTFNGSFNSIHSMGKNNGEPYIKCHIEGGKFDRDVNALYNDNATLPEGKVLRQDEDGYYTLHGPFYEVGVTAYPAEGGTVTGGDTVEEGESATVKAEANSGYEFDGWYDGDNLVSTSKEYTIESVTGNMNLTAKFKIPDVPVNPRGNEDPSSDKPTEEEFDKKVTATNTDGDFAGSTFGLLKARGVSKGKKKILLKWTDPKLGAAKYVVYGNQCNTKGKKYKYVKLKEFNANTFKYIPSDILGKKLKKGTYYKFLVTAVDKNGRVVAISKTVHVTTKGKRGNDKAVKRVKPTKKAKYTLNAGKTKKLKVKEVKGKKKVSRHRAVSWESSNPNVVVVSKKGKVTAKGAGTSTIYAYAQNGVYTTFKITVK